MGVRPGKVDVGRETLRHRLETLKTFAPRTTCATWPVGISRHALSLTIIINEPGGKRFLVYSP